ncbi:coenzyme F420-0:L-glutamate ligase [Quadrisphaera sp. DSM 44207]|uniref:coenzyme F420-0:L-glutamate ligase n=1 Tax=Quadrisphaera sp. DSM 44207 TaxID=1881057 RepID=UPI0008864884|nr:coenzyme F420-0:L-glutamate ligase [Quadrisphaera sp. DSM 44207]SDQ09517.1 coenzyme F420-0:L-glutamate ligase / coenzyme F420-1:gamma-L-glutamate ligase [Quadrisphaera sp. DSM 44207]
MTAPHEVTAVAVPGLPEVRAGDDLAGLVVRACAAAGLALRDDDVLVVASKVVAKAEGRSVAASDRGDAVRSQTVRVVAERRLPDGRTTQVVQSRSGPVMAAAGVDASDVEPGTVLLLPADPDASARALRARVAQLAGVRPAVVVSDTGGRPWRDGVTDFALGAAGLELLDDVRGRLDRTGRPLEVTVRAVGDEVAALADLVKGKAAGLPVALVRGLGAAVAPEDGPGAAALVRVGPADWFAHGHVEAVRAALGVPVGVPAASGGVDPAPIAPGGPVAERVARALLVARAGRAPSGVVAEADGERVLVRGEPFGVGVLVERVRAALWAEALDADVVVAPSAASATVTASERPSPPPPR